MTEPPVKRKTRVCFSLAAYSKELIAHLHQHSNIPIAAGLTQAELSTIESTFHFSFPPDLRSILQEGLPVGPGFPNWRSSSHQQLDILCNLPILGICKEVSCRKFWHHRWGDRPENDDETIELAKKFLKKSPVLVPVYRNCYIPSTYLAGNPVFYVNGLDVKLWSYDVVGFFQQAEFKGNEGVLRPRRLAHFLGAPAWAATEARVVEFWTELVELRRGTAVGGRRRWWRGNELGRCLEDVWWKLRDGGWREDDVEDMMMMDMDGSSRSSSSSTSTSSWSSSDDDNITQDVGWHVRELSFRLLRAGWSRKDVVDSLGCLTLSEDGQCDDDRVAEIEDGGGDSWVDFLHTTTSHV